MVHQRAEGALGPRNNTGQTTPGQNTARAVMLTGLPACHLLSMWLIYYYGCVTWLGHHAVSRDIASNKQVCCSYIGPWLNQCGWPALLMRHLGVPRVASFLDELPGLARAELAVVAPWAMASQGLGQASMMHSDQPHAQQNTFHHDAGFALYLVCSFPKSSRSRPAHVAAVFCAKAGSSRSFSGQCSS